MRLLSGLLLLSLLVGCGESEIQKRLRLEKEAAQVVETFLSCSVDHSRTGLTGWIHFFLSKKPESDDLSGQSYFVPNSRSKHFLSDHKFPKIAWIGKEDEFNITSFFSFDKFCCSVTLDRSTLDLWRNDGGKVGSCKVVDKETFRTERWDLLSEYERRLEAKPEPQPSATELEKRSKLEARKI